MYDVDSIKRKVKKEGVDKTILDLLSGNFSDEQKKELSDSHILCNGYPNLSAIYSLV